MGWIFLAIAFIYTLAAFGIGGGVLWVTLWAYDADGKMVSETVSAGVINTAAAMAMGFFGGFDMIFTIWQYFRNQEAEKARDRDRTEEREAAAAERAEERKALAAERAAEREATAAERAEERRVAAAEREAAAAARAEERQALLETLRAEREQFIAQMRAERERNDILTAKLLELTEAVINRNNGNGNRNGGGDGNGAAA